MHHVVARSHVSAARQPFHGRADGDSSPALNQQPFHGRADGDSRPALTQQPFHGRAEAVLTTLRREAAHGAFGVSAR